MLLPPPMKHTASITLLLLGIFLLAQFIGIAIIYQYIDLEKSTATGKTTFKALPIGERPPVQEKTSYIPIMAALLIGTAMLWMLLKYNLQWIWKLWFLIAVTVSLTVAGSVLMPTAIALAVALVLGIWKIFRPNFWVQNITELFIYGGLAAIFVPIFNLLSVGILIVLIAVYDAYAVWKSKHMVTIATAQVKAGKFAGLLIPYQNHKLIAPKAHPPEAKGKLQKIRTAVLGGGDIGFPLIFAGVVLKEIGLWQSLVIPFFSALGLAFLLWWGKDKQFYPAMPFIGAGCFIGLGVVWLIGLVM